MSKEISRAADWNSCIEGLAIECAKQGIDSNPLGSFPIQRKFGITVTCDSPGQPLLVKEYLVSYTGDRALNSSGERLHGTYHIRNIKIEALACDQTHRP